MEKFDAMDLVKLVCAESKKDIKIKIPGMIILFFMNFRFSIIRPDII